MSSAYIGKGISVTIPDEDISRSVMDRIAILEQTIMFLDDDIEKMKSSARRQFDVIWMDEYWATTEHGQDYQQDEFE